MEARAFLENETEDDRPRDARRASRRSPHANKREMAALAAALCRRMVSAKAVLLIADALDLPARDLLAYKSGHFQAALHQVSTSRFEEVVHALSGFEAPGLGQVDGARRGSLDEIARMALDLREPGSKLALAEQAIVGCAMSLCGGNQSAAARMLCMERKALARRVAKGRSES
jgi:DNA-binding NtrC family response regulator